MVVAVGLAIAGIVVAVIAPWSGPRAEATSYRLPPSQSPDLGLRTTTTGYVRSKRGCSAQRPARGSRRSTAHRRPLPGPRRCRGGDCRRRARPEDGAMPQQRTVLVTRRGGSLRALVGRVDTKSASNDGGVRGKVPGRSHGDRRLRLAGRRGSIEPFQWPANWTVLFTPKAGLFDPNGKLLASKGRKSECQAARSPAAGRAQVFGVVSARTAPCTRSTRRPAADTTFIRSCRGHRTDLPNWVRPGTPASRRRRGNSSDLSSVTHQYASADIRPWSTKRMRPPW